MKKNKLTTSKRRNFELNREILRLLTTSQLIEVAGGFIESQCVNADTEHSVATRSGSC